MSKQQMTRVIALFLVCVLPSTAFGVPRATPQNLNSPCNIHLQFLGAPYDPVKEFGYSVPPPAAVEAVKRELQPTVATYIVAPETSGDFERMFGRQPTSREVDDMQSFQTKLKDALGQSTVEQRLSAHSFESTLAGSSASFAIVVGHNDGGSFKFSDKSSLGLADMLAIAAKHGKALIILSCKAVQNSGDKDTLGTAREIGYPEGLFIARALKKSIEDASGPISLAGVKSQLQTIEKQANFKFNVKYLILQGCAMAAAGIAIAIAIYLLEEDRKKRQKGNGSDVKISPSTHLVHRGWAMVPALT